MGNRIDSYSLSVYLHLSFPFSFSLSLSPLPLPPFPIYLPIYLYICLFIYLFIYPSVYPYLYFSLTYKRRLYITWPHSRIAVLWERKSGALKTRSVSVRVTRSAAVDSYRSRKYARPSLSVLLFLLLIVLSISLHFRLSARSVSCAGFIMPVELPRWQNFRMHSSRGRIAEMIFA